MQYNTVEQGVRCQLLEDQMRRARGDTGNWEDQANRLHESISTQNRLLDNLRRQIERTGDKDGFAPDIQRAEDEIEKLMRQVIIAESNVIGFRDKSDGLQQEMSQNGCGNFA